MPENAGICTNCTTTVPPMINFEGPDLTKELDMNELCQVLTCAKSFGKERTKYGCE